MIKKLLTNLFFSNIIFFLITSIVILGFNLTPMITQFKHTPAGRSFAFIHNNTQDFFFYQSLMNEGGSGAWLTTNPYTTEPHKPSIIFAYFLWLGKLSKLFGISYALTYHLVRIILSILFLSFIFYLLSFISLPYPRLAFFFFLFAAPFMHTVNTGGKLTRVPYMYWWTGMDPIRRVAYLPHHIFGGLLLVITFILIIKYFDNPKTKYIIWCCLLTIPLAFVHPPSLFILLLIIPPALILYFITASKFSLSSNPKAPNYKHQDTNKHQITSTNNQTFSNLKFRILNLFGIWNLEFGIYKFLLGYWFIGLFVLLFMVSQTNQGFPWNQYINWEKTLQFPLDRELIGALGILFPFSILGIVRAIASKRFHYILIACWLFVPLFLIPFAPYLNISNVRLIQGVPYLPMAILATLGIEIIISNLKTQISKLHLKSKNLEKFIGLLVYWVIGLFFIIFTLPTLSWSLKDQIREYWPIYGNVYFDNRLFDAFSFINRSFPAKANTLSTFYTGNYLPAFTNTISFIGHFGYTYNSQVKQVQVQKFFENKMSIQEAKELIMNNKIALVFQGPEEKPIYSSYLYPSVLKPVYDKEEVTLYVLK